MKENIRSERRIAGGIIAIVILSVCLVITTFAAAYASVSVEYNIFRTGRININLNGGEPVIKEGEFLFEPGMTVEKQFFIENLSTWEVYYKIYFDNVQGELGDLLLVEVLDGETVLCSGTMTQLSKDKVPPAGESLAVMEKKELTIRFHFPEEAGNSAKGTSLVFDLYADAVQTKNNPDRQFE